MNKILKFFASIFKGIYKAIDKVIITPISKTIYIINNKIRSKSGGVEKLLNKPYMLVYLSLAFAVGIFFLVDSRVVSLVQTEAEILVDQPIKVQYNKEAYVVEGIPESVDITLIGRKSDLYLAKQLGDHEVIMDLTDLEEGTHKVRLTLNQTVDSLNYKLDPSTVTVNIKKRISTLKTITYDLLNAEKMDPTLSVQNVELSKSEVVVKGSEDALEKVATVKALIDLSDSRFVEKGNYPIDNVQLVAYDDTGKVIEDVEIVHGTVTATIELNSYSIEVPIKVVTQGSLITGKAISSLLINDKESYKVQIYGDQEVLDSISYLPVTIDISEQGAKSKTYNVTLSKPSGVRHISEKSVTIKLDFDDEAQKTIEITSIQQRNLSSKFKAYIVGDATVSVQVKGIQSVIASIDPATIKGYVDLTNYSIGEHDVKVEIEADDPRITFVVSKTIKVVIDNN